ncbi:hypothetical protein ABPG72_002215 [Tetrahymena utriculariae]
MTNNTSQTTTTTTSQVQPEKVCSSPQQVKQNQAKLITITPKEREIRPWRSIIGGVFMLTYLTTPFIMCYIYFKAIQGDVLCITLSVMQIITQIYAKRWDAWCRLLSYFDMDLYFDEFGLHFEEELAKEKVLLGIHPHNVVTLGMTLNQFKGRFGKQSICASRVLLYMPLLGMLHKFSGIVPVDAQNLKKLMSANKNLSIVPGGFEEATISSSTKDKVFIKNRKGFIKFALRYGYNVHPVYIFGENKMFEYFEKFEEFRLLMNKVKLVGLIFWSRLGLLPEPRLKVNTVVGKAIKLPQIAEPTAQDVDKYHTIYIEELQRIFDENKIKFGDNHDLIIY